MSWIVSELPGGTDAFVWFARLRGRSYPVLLESRNWPDQRFDIVAADPAVTVESLEGQTTVVQAGHARRSRRDPFGSVEREVSRRRPRNPCPVDTPFTGGAIGYYGYELARQVERLPAPPANELDMPDMVVGIYDWFIVVDHARGRSLLVSSPHVTRIEHETVRQRLKEPAPALAPAAAGPISGNFSRSVYAAAIERIKSLIHDGDCYQVNLAQRFEVAFDGDPVSLYSHLRQSHPAPYSACLAFPKGQVLSYSPERFLRVRDRDVITEPIKGTRPRGDPEKEDRRLAAELRTSEKDRAENLMIVDLMRNDLGRCCETGSIHVKKLFELRSFPNVHHLVSLVAGRLRADVSAMDLIRACFPGGSITGAPKIRAMEIINELETSRRYAYCGAIGYYDYEGSMDTSLAIRTIVCAGGRVCFWGGGGIVADSDPRAEYQECLDKVNMIEQALSTMHRNSPAAQNTR